MNKHYKNHIILVIICSLITVFFYFPLPGWSASLGQRIRMTIGQQRVLDVPAPLEQVAIGDPTVADVKIVSRGKQILVTALGPGVTDLLTWDLNGKQKKTLIQVVQKDIRIIQTEVEGILRDIEGIQIRSVGDRIVVDGELFTKNDMERLKKVEEIYPSEVVILARMSSSITRLIASEVNRSLQKNGYFDVQAEGIGDKIFLEGTAHEKEDLNAINVLCSAYFDNFVNLVKVGGKTEALILIDVHFVEIGRRFLDKFGMDWDNSARFEVTNLDYIATLIKKSQSSTIGLGTAENFGVVINMMETNALARSLAHPRLVCRSGEEAHFVAGGEIPIPIITEEKIMVEFKEYGILLTVSPVAHRDGRISTAVKAESSTIDYSVQVMNFPGFKKRKVETVVGLQEDQVLILSGLVNHTDAKDMEKMPGIAKLPIIGELFKSRDFSDDKTEMVIFLTSRILDSADDINEKTIRDLEDKYQKLGEEMEPDIFD